MPVVVYGRRQHLISVYSWPDSRETHGTDFSESTRNGYNVVAWRSGGLSLEAGHLLGSAMVSVRIGDRRLSRHWRGNIEGIGRGWRRCSYQL